MYAITIIVLWNQVNNRTIEASKVYNNYCSIMESNEKNNCGVIKSMQ